MARELAQIAADPQPYECVRITDTVVYRVWVRDPNTVTYRREAYGEESVERAVSLPEWRDLVLYGVPCEPHTTWP